MKKLAPGYEPEAGKVDKDTWHQITQLFEDSNIYQTWSHDSLRRGLNQVSHFILRSEGEIVAAAQLRVLRVPFMKTGIAYVRWGPLWKTRKEPANPDVFRQAVRALRNEYVTRRGLMLRLYPSVYKDEDQTLEAILREEGYREHKQETEDRTLLLDIRPEAEEVRRNFHKKWRNSLNQAEKNLLEVIEGEDDELFGTFIGLYREMLSRKKFAVTTDIDRFRTMQRDLPHEWKMRVFLCRSGEGVGAGAICSALGVRGIYLFGATNTQGLENKGSYLLQWRIIQWLKEKGCTCYDLNGINPDRNPGTYRFKHGLAGKSGRDVLYLGQYEGYATVAGHLISAWEDRLLALVRRLSIFRKVKSERSFPRT